MRALFLALLPILHSTCVRAQTCEPALPAYSIEDGGTLDAEAKDKILDQLKQHCLTDIKAQVAVTETYQTHGYVRVSVKEVRTADSAGTAFHVTPGNQYRVSRITFQSSKHPSETGLRGFFNIKDGDVFNSFWLRAGIESLRSHYGADGFVNMTVVPSMEFNEAAATVSIKLDVDRGGIYRIGELRISGIEPRPGVSKKLVEIWDRRKKGKVAALYRIAELYPRFPDNAYFIGEDFVPELAKLADQLPLSCEVKLETEERYLHLHCSYFDRSPSP